MKVMCPQCNTVYNLPSERIPTMRAVATCRKCGGRIVVDPSIPDRAETMAAPTRSPAQSTAPSTAPEVSDHRWRVIVADYPELQGLSSEKFALEQILTPNSKGGYKSRRNKFKIKVLMGVHGTLNRMLRDGERVMRIGRGVAFYLLEILLGNGLLTILYNYYAIVCTNQRLLFININSRKNRPTHYLFQMVYEEVKKIKRGSLSGAFVIYRTQGRRRVFQYVKSYLAKEMKQFIMERKGSVRAGGPPKTFLENLCPSCFVPLGKGLISCPTCRTLFKESKKAFLRSFILPGLGDIYLGHRFLGALELIGSLIVWSFLIALLISGEKGALFMVVFFLVTYNLIDGLLTLHMAKKGYMAAKE